MKNRMRQILNNGLQVFVYLFHHVYERHQPWDELKQHGMT